MASLFDTVVNFTLDREGRVVNYDPTDRGGPTAYGISQRAHPKAWKGGPPTIEEAIDIYRLVYWQDNGVSPLPPAVAAALFDYRVHSGDTAIKQFQELIGVKPDGDIGDVTKKAAQAYAEMLLGRELTELRRANLIKITEKVEHFRRWGRGWSLRCDKVNRFLRDLIRKQLTGVFEKAEPPLAPTRLRKKAKPKAKDQDDK
jgi:lysozyme family protein